MIFRYVGLILAVPLLLSVQLIAGAQHLVPASIQPCIRQLNTNRAPVKAAFLSGTYQERDKTFYFLNLFPLRSEQGVRDGVISSDSSGCQVLAQYSSGNPIPVTRSLPLSVARGLTLNILKSDIAKLGGRQKYQARLNLAVKNTGRLYLSPNEVWAHEQLGISIPPSARILPRPSR
jgi:hypothetical protein